MHTGWRALSTLFYFDLLSTSSSSASMQRRFRSQHDQGAARCLDLLESESLTTTLYKRSTVSRVPDDVTLLVGELAHQNHNEVDQSPNTKSTKGQ